MTDHPSMEKLELFQQGKLRGAELWEVVSHLEECDDCFFHLPLQNSAELLSRIFKPEDDIIVENDEYEN